MNLKSFNMSLASTMKIISTLYIMFTNASWIYAYVHGNTNLYSTDTLVNPRKFLNRQGFVASVGACKTSIVQKQETLVQIFGRIRFFMRGNVTSSKIWLSSWWVPVSASLRKCEVLFKKSAIFLTWVSLDHFVVYYLYPDNVFFCAQGIFLRIKPLFL